MVVSKGIALGAKIWYSNCIAPGRPLRLELAKEAARQLGSHGFVEDGKTFRLAPSSMNE